MGKKRKQKRLVIVRSPKGNIGWTKQREEYLPGTEVIHDFGQWTYRGLTKAGQMEPVLDSFRVDKETGIAHIEFVKQIQRALGYPERRIVIREGVAYWRSEPNTMAIPEPKPQKKEAEIIADTPQPAPEIKVKRNRAQALSSLRKKA